MSTKKDKLSIRERKFIKGLAEGLTPTEAMRRAGYAENTALAKAGQKVGERRIQASIQEMMESRGLTKEKLLSKLDEGLDSTKVISAAIIFGKPADKEVQANEQTNDFIDVPDFATRHKYLDTALKLGSHYPNEKVEHSGKVNVTVVMNKHDETL